MVANPFCRFMLQAMWRLALLLSLIVPLFSAQAQKVPPLTVRLHGESRNTETDSFTSEVQLAFPDKKIRIGKVPIISEKDIAAIYPYPSPDGNIGVYLILDASGTNRLEEYTTQQRDSLVVALINGRVATAMRVDKRVTDGVLSIPTGFSLEEILVLQSKHPTVGKEKEFDQQKKDALAVLAKNHKRKVTEEKAAKKAAAQKPVQ